MPSSNYYSDSRSLLVEVGYFNAQGTKVLAFDGEKITKFKLVDTRSSSNCMQVGTACSQTITLEFDNLTAQERTYVDNGSVITVTIKCYANSTTETTQLGVFVITEDSWSERTDGNFRGSVTGYDQMINLDKPFPYTTLESTRSIYTLMSTICTDCNLTRGDGWSQLITVSTVPSNVTYREVVSYLAGLQGTNAYIEPHSYRDNKSVLSAGWYTESQTVTLDSIYLDGFSKAMTSVTIDSLLSGTSESPAYYPYDPSTPTVIPSPEQSFCFSNPYVTQSNIDSIAEIIFDTVDEYEYYEGEMKWRGDPTLRSGTKFVIPSRDGESTYVFYSMEKEIVYDGGMYEIIRSYGANTDTVSFTEDATQQDINSLKRRVSNLENSGGGGVYQYTMATNQTVTSSEGRTFVYDLRFTGTNRCDSSSTTGIGCITVYWNEQSSSDSSLNPHEYVDINLNAAADVTDYPSESEKYWNYWQEHHFRNIGVITSFIDSMLECYETPAVCPGYVLRKLRIRNNSNSSYLLLTANNHSAVYCFA